MLEKKFNSRVVDIHKTFSNIYHRHYELVSKFNVRLKTILRQGHRNQNFTLTSIQIQENFRLNRFFRSIYNTLQMYWLQFEYDGTVSNLIVVKNYTEPKL